MFLQKLQKRVDFIRDLVRFKDLLRESGDERFPLSWWDLYPCVNDKTGITGFDSHYILHPAWAARVLARTKPAQHIDISSSLSFVTLVSAFLPVKFYDYRPAELHLSGLTSQQADLLKLPFADQSIESLSCMHVVEHVGLGRYGDPLDPKADLQAISELKRVLKPGGQLLFVVPVGKPRIQYNAHRIYSYEQVMEAFQGLELKEFALIPDSPAELRTGATADEVARQKYGCGCFLFTRPPGR